MWPFKWKLLRLSSTFLWYCLLCPTRWLSTSSPGFLPYTREPWERGWVALTFQSLDEMLTSLLNEGSCSLLCSVTANHDRMSLSCQLTVRNIFISCSASIVFIEGFSHYKEDNSDRHNNRLHIVLFSRWHSRPCGTPHGETIKKTNLFSLFHTALWHWTIMAWARVWLRWER